MNTSNDAVLDYYLLPSLDFRPDALRIKDENGVFLDAYQFDDLGFFVGMAESVCVESAA